MEGEFQDWEVLHNSDETDSVNSSDSVENMKGLEGIDGVSEGMIRTDHFSLDLESHYMENFVDNDVCVEDSVNSDNLNWVDPESETNYPNKESVEFWPDSGSDRSDDRKFGEFEGKYELGFVQNEKIQAGFEGVGEIGGEGEDLGKSLSDSGKIGPISMEFGDFDHNTEMGIGDNANSPEGSELLGEEKGGDGEAGGDVASSGEESVAIGAVKPSGEEEKRVVVWWKVPFEFLKYCACRANPAWTISVAAAVMGFVILGRRLYKMKRKSQSLQVKVTMDDKKVSQFMSRAARLNEAFSVVKRVPVIRPTLPAAGVTAWPVMSLR
ncbi:unnamed protein product [Camellia sinensis]